MTKQIVMYDPLQYKMQSIKIDNAAFYKKSNAFCLWVLLGS